MTIDPVKAARLRSTDLARDFADPALGRLGGRSVRAAPTGRPRAAGAPAAPRRSRPLLTRFLNAVTPARVRAESKYRGGVEDFSRSLGDLLGELRGQAGTGGDARALGRRLADLLEQAKPVTSRGTDLPDLLQARANIHIGRLGFDALLDLRKALRTDAVPDAVERLPGKRRADAVAVLGKLDGAISARINVLAREKGLALATSTLEEASRILETRADLTEVLHAAASVARNASESQQAVGGRPSDEYVYGIVKDALAAMPEKARRLLEAASTKELLLLSAGRSAGAADDIDRMTDNEIGRRADRMLEDFRSGADKLLGHDTATHDDLKGLVRDLSATAAVFGRLTGHARTHGLDLPGVADKRAELQAHAEALLHPDGLFLRQLSLDELDLDELGALRAAVESLGLADSDAVDAVKATLGQRVEAAQQEVDDVLADVAGALHDGDAAAALRALRELPARVDDKQRAAEASGQKFEGADDTTPFRGDAIGEAVGKLPEAERFGLLADLGHPDVQAAGQLLASVGSKFTIQADPPPVALPMFRAGSFLGELYLETDARVRESLQQQQGGGGGDPIPLPPSGHPLDAAYGREDLTPAFQSAIREVYGVDIPRSEADPVRVVAGDADAKLNAAVAREVAKPPSQSELARYRSDLEPVTAGFVTDFVRAGRGDYVIDGVSSGDEAVVGRTRDEKVAWAAGQIDRLTGGNETQALVASHHASQAGALALTLALGNAASPIRLPDGTAGRLVASLDGQRTAYTLSRDDQGNVVIRTELTGERLARFIDNGGKQHLFDDDTARMRFAFDVTVAPDGTATSGPVSFAYTLDDADYGDADWINAKLTANGRRDTILWSALFDYSRSVHADENVEFLMALDQFKADPRTDAARRIFDRFIAADGARELNTRDSLRNAVGSALAAAEGGGDDQVPQGIFAALERDILDLVKGQVPDFASAYRDGRFKL